MKRKATLIVIVIALLFYLTCYHHTDNYQFGITQNLFTGVVESDSHRGHHVTYPWVLAVRIDTRPHRVCIASASRNMNCRLVQFDSSQYMELISREGFQYYWWYNRISFNWEQDTYRGVDNLLLGHSYGKNRCPCVKILQEVGDETE